MKRNLLKLCRAKKISRRIKYHLLTCKKIKKLLTGNKDAVWTLDCFHDVCALSLSPHSD